MVLWPIACFGALCVASGKAKRRRQRSASCPMPAPRRGQNCPPMSWEGPEITSHMVAAWEAGERDATALAVGALRAVYPTDGDGQALRWPTATADCAEKKVLESRVILRAQRLVAEGFDVEAEALWYAEGGY